MSPVDAYLLVLFQVSITSYILLSHEIVHHTLLIMYLWGLLAGNPTSDILDSLEKNAAKTSRGFRAPVNIARAIRASAELPFKEGMARERELFGELATGSQAPALQYQFFSERSVSTPPKVADKSKIPLITSVGVVGGGTMVNTLVYLAVC